MKTVTMILALTVIAISLGSCKKTRTCTCVDSDDGYTETIPIVKSTKKDAKTYCESFNYTGTSYSTTCTVN